MLKSIELRNWKTHRHTAMNFQKGVNVLVGVMGAGKSSIMDAISFALFGTFPSLVHKRVSTEDIISSRPSVEDNAEVRLAFTIDGNEYTVTRKISRKEPSSARLERNGSYLQTQPARVNEEIESLIKVDYDTFSRAVYAEQNRIDYLLELTKGERKRQMDQMLGLDSFARAEENSTSLINSLRSMISDEEQMMAQQDAAGAKSQLEKLASERSLILAAQKSITEGIGELESRVKGLDRSISSMRQLQQRSKLLEREIAELSGRKSMLEKEIGRLSRDASEKGQLERELSELKGEMSGMEERRTKLKFMETESAKRMSAAEAYLKQNRERAVQRDRIAESLKGIDVTSMTKDISSLEFSIQGMVRNISSLETSRADAAKWARELESHLAKCPVCERDLPEEMRKGLIAQRRDSIREYDESITAAESAIKSARASLEQLKKKHEELSKASGRMSEFRDVDSLIEKFTLEHGKLSEEHARASAEYDSISKRRDSVAESISKIAMKLDAASRLEKHMLEHGKVSKEAEAKRSEAASMKFDEKEMYSTQESLTKESAALSEMREKASSNERYLRSLDSQISEKTKIIAMYESMRVRIEQRRSQIASMNRFRSALVETGTELRASLVRSINAIMNDVWTELYPYADYRTIRLDSRKDDYMLEAHVNGGNGNGWVEINGIASGGERSMACLAMRIALSMVIVPNLKWLILDEPTHNIDENGIGKFIDVLGNSLPKVVEQIFIITHDGALKNIASARVYSLERNKDADEYTSVVES